jgi:Flp pilus assembly CpaE family ATPase
MKLNSQNNHAFDPGELLLVTEEPDTVLAVSEALGTNGDFARRRVCRNLQQLTERLESSRTAAVLVDIDRQPKRTLSDLEPIIAHFSEARFVVLSRERADALMIEAMQVGARHYLVKPSIREDLAEVLHRLVPNGAHRRRVVGPMITVLSASGGCGATTIAANLAKELHLLSGETSLLIDFDCYYGGVATCLGLEGQYGLGDVLCHPTAIDADLIQTSTVPGGKGMRVLLSPASTNFRTCGPLAGERLPEAIDAVADTGACTVMDAPRLGSAVESILARASRVTLLVFQLCVKDIRTAKVMRLALLDSGVEASRVVMVANRFRKRHSMVSVDDAARVLGDRIERLQNDYKAASLALNFGQPLADAAPRSGLRKDIARLAARVRDEFLLPAATPQPRETAWRSLSAVAAPALPAACNLGEL